VRYRNVIKRKDGKYSQPDALVQSVKSSLHTEAGRRLTAESKKIKEDISSVTKSN
jgi:hypothetical protein